MKKPSMERGVETKGRNLKNQPRRENARKGFSSGEFADEIPSMERGVETKGRNLN